MKIDAEGVSRDQSKCGYYIKYLQINETKLNNNKNNS